MTIKEERKGKRYTNEKCRNIVFFSSKRAFAFRDRGREGGGGRGLISHEDGTVVEGGGGGFIILYARLK